MKTLLQAAILCAFFFLSVNTSTAQTTLIHYWDFDKIGANVYNNPNIPPIKADMSVLDTNAATINYVLAPNAPRNYGGFLDGVTPGDTTAANLSDGSMGGTGLRVRNPTNPDSMELQFHFPTTGFKNIVVKYALESSGSGDSIQNFDYSVDGGANWKTGDMTVNGSTATFLSVNQPQFQGMLWGPVTITFGEDAAVNNNPNLIWRIKFGGGRVNQPNGNNRFDNLMVEGTKASGGVQTQNSNSASTPLILFPNPARTFVNIENPFSSDAMITVLDADGRKIENRVLFGGQSTKLEISDICAGSYYVIFKSTDARAQRVGQFMKE